MTKVHSIDSNVKFPDMEHYDMGKASEMALYLAHCDFYPFRSVIENNKIALDVISESYRQMAAKAREKNDFVSEQWAMTSGTLHSCRVELLTQYSLLLTMVSLLEEAVNTLCLLYHDLNHLDKELKDIKGNGLERAAKYLKEVAGIVGLLLINNGSILLLFEMPEIWLFIMAAGYIKILISMINFRLDIEKKTINFIWSMAI